MPALKNARHERFCQLVASGMSATEAHASAGYKRNRKAASNLMARMDIRGRLQELKTETAQSFHKSREQILYDYEKVFALALTLDQPSPAVSALREQGKLLDYYPTAHHRGQIIEGEARPIEEMTSSEVAALLRNVRARRLEDGSRRPN